MSEQKQISPEEPDNLPIPDWHMKILDERMARYGPHVKEEGTSLEDFEKELFDLLKKG